MKHHTVPTRERLIAAAIALFQTQGYFGTGVAEILVEANAPKGSLYHHFPGGKAELAVAAVEAVSDAVCAQAHSALTTGKTPAALLRTQARAIAAWLVRTDYAQGALLCMLAQECAMREPVVAQAVARAYDRWRGVLITHTNGDELGAKTAADVIIATLEGALMLARLHRNAQSLVDTADALSLLLEA